MKKKLFRSLMAVPLVVLLSGCLFMLQGFVVLDGHIEPGTKTKARFTLRPATATNDRIFQFVVVGVDDGGDLAVGKATWGTNGKFGGPKKMPVSPGLPAAMDASNDCVVSGFNFGSVSGTTWKAFLLEVRTKGKVKQAATVDAVVQATQGATEGPWPVIGVTGKWVDDGDGLVNAVDTFTCSGASTSSVYVGS
jgi:hypothetical protein